ncbi:MAG: NACHT domain-containing protein [Candidatus Aminicenantes bacterium]|nr:NACHT domain-containing protein [Candidatus Aminicenantes bacterium]
MIDFIVNNLKTILGFTLGIIFTAITIRYKEAITRGTNFVIDSLFSLARVYFLMMKRYKKSITRIYRETKVGYRSLRLDLERNYISLRVSSFIHYRQKEPDEELKSKKSEVLDVLKEYRHLVILGHPGAGKTTLMQWLLLKYAHGHMKKELDENLIPIFIALRSLQSGQSVDDLLIEVLNQHHFKGGEKFIRKQMEKGRCLLIFDGMDEIIDDDTRKKFIKDINGTYGTLYGKSRIIITSRIEDFPDDRFPASFRQMEILDLDMEQVRDFITGILETEEKPGGLIGQIEKSEGLKKFVTNPLMLSLLTFVYRESRRKLPDDRVKVYNICMQLMMEDRDSRKGIYEYRNKFDTDDKELLLGKLAYDFSLRNKWRFSEKEVLEHWQNNLPANLTDRDLKKLLKEVCKSNGILRHLSGKELCFLHRTFQEYYTAKEICKKEQALLVNREEQMLYGKFSEKEWQEITLFLVGIMDDAGYLVQHILHQSPLFALHCLVYAKRVKDEIIEEVLKAIPGKLTIANLKEISDNLVYLANRFGLEKISQFLTNVLKQVKAKNIKILFWQVIDRLILTFSPRKGMVYLPSGFVQMGKKEKWVPGFWMDVYPVTNGDYQNRTEGSKADDLPRHWQTRQNGEPFVTSGMKKLPVVDIDYEQAAAFASALNKTLPVTVQWHRVGEKDSREGGG